MCSASARRRPRGSTCFRGRAAGCRFSPVMDDGGRRVESSETACRNRENRKKKLEKEKVLGYSAPRIDFRLGEIRRAENTSALRLS